jgi:hypothetical protein
LSFLRIDCGQAFQSLMDGDEFDRWLGVASPVIDVQRYSELLSPTLCGLLTTGVVDQDISHHPGRQAVKLGAPLPLNLLLIHQPQIGLVNQRRWLQGVVCALAPKKSYG